MTPTEQLKSCHCQGQTFLSLELCSSVALQSYGNQRVSRYDVNCLPVLCKSAEQRKEVALRLLVDGLKGSGSPLYPPKCSLKNYPSTYSMIWKNLWTKLYKFINPSLFRELLMHCENSSKPHFNI